MTRPEDVGQAERRTAPGGGSGSQRGAPLAGGSLGSGGGSLNLIHGNKVPNPVSMRVSGRFAPRLLRPVRAALYWPLLAIPHLPGGPLHYLWVVRFIVELDAPLRRLILGRALHAKP